MRMISLVSWCRSCRLPKLLDWIPSGRRVVVFAAMLMLMISEKGTWGRDDMPLCQTGRCWIPVDEQMTWCAPIPSLTGVITP